MRNLALCEK